LERIKTFLILLKELRKIMESQSNTSQPQNSGHYPSNRLTEEEMKELQERSRKTHQEIEEHIRKQKEDMSQNK